MGALEWRKIVHEHQRWRLLTCMWLHAGVIYLLTNMLSLIFINIHLEQQFGFSAGKVKEPSVISPGGSKTEERQSHDVSNQNDMSQDGGDQPRGEVNMEASISAEDVIRAGGFGAKDDIGSFLPVASDSTDFEESIRSARDYEEPQPEVQRPGLGWPKE